MKSQEKKIIALLPMKGNSERVPGKNLKLFDGQPLFYHILMALHHSKYITEIIINTDSAEIGKKAEAFSNKVKVHERPKEICGDFVSMNEIIKYDIMQSNGDVYLQTHSTNPLLKTETIDNAIEEFLTLNQSEFDSLFSVTKLQTRLYWENSKPINHNPEELLRTQDLPPVFEENSNFFIFTKNSFSSVGDKRIGLKPKMFAVNKIEAIDIDENEDFIIAEAIHKLNM